MAFASTTVWEARPSGDDTNGGGFDPGVASPGTDYSQQDAAQTTYTDLVIDGATNTKITSAAHPFDSTSPGNIINITSGTGFTVQRVVILSVAGAVATCDKAVGTVGSTGGNGKLGGGFATPGMAMSLATASNTVYVKLGTYTLSSTANVAGGRITIGVGGSPNNTPFQLIGYNTNRTLTNSDALPTLEAGASMAGVTVQLIFNNSNYTRVRNFKLRNTGAYAGGSLSTMFHQFGVYNLGERLDIDCNNVSGWYGIYQGGTENHVYDFIVQRASTPTPVGVQVGGVTCSLHYGVVANCTTVGFSGAGQHVGCIAYNNTGNASDGFNTTSAAGATYTDCLAYGNGRNGFAIYYDTKCDNCLAVNNGLGHSPSCYGFEAVSSGQVPIGTLYNCAGYGNLTANVSPNIPGYAQIGFVALTGNPITNASGGDFSLNNTAGAGAACRGTGYPAAFFGTSTNSYRDIGPVQHKESPGTYVTITSSTDPSTPGQSVTFTATVTATDASTPTGTVQFSIDGTAFGSAVTLTSGSATSGATTTLAAGAHTITASYTPSGSYLTSRGTTVQVVQSPATATSPVPIRLMREQWEDMTMFGQELQLAFQTVPGWHAFGAQLASWLAQNK